MAYRSGIAAQLGAATEDTWGTIKTPDHFYEFNKEALKGHRARIQSKGLRANNRVLRSDRWKEGRTDASGTVDFEVQNKGFGLWFKHMLGGTSVTPDGAGYHHAYTMADPYGLGLTVQVGRPDLSGTVQPFTYSGCKVTNWHLQNAVDNILELQVSLDGKAEATSTGLASASYPSTTELFYFTEGSITVGGSSSYNIKNWSLQSGVGLKTDRFFINGTGVKSEQVVNAWATPTGNLACEFTDLTGYNLYVNGTVSALVLTYQTVTTYDTSKPYKLVITVPAIRFDGETPNVQGPDVLDFTGAFVGLNDGTNSPVTIDYYTTDAAP